MTPEHHKKWRTVAPFLSCIAIGLVPIDVVLNERKSSNERLVAALFIAVAVVLFAGNAYALYVKSRKRVSSD
jgi:uncharacterized membrane protein YgdD (TMEM256/DUF423 family)